MFRLGQCSCAGASPVGRLPLGCGGIIGRQRDPSFRTAWASNCLMRPMNPRRRPSPAGPRSAARNLPPGCPTLFFLAVDSALGAEPRTDLGTRRSAEGALLLHGPCASPVHRWVKTLRSAFGLTHSVSGVATPVLRPERAHTGMRPFDCPTADRLGSRFPPSRQAPANGSGIRTRSAAKSGPGGRSIRPGCCLCGRSCRDRGATPDWRRRAG